MIRKTIVFHYFSLDSCSGHAKVVLKSNLKDMEYMVNMYNNRNNELWCTYIIDDGRTQVERDSLTTLAFNPIRKKDAPDFIKNMKLL